MIITHLFLQDSAHNYKISLSLLLISTSAQLWHSFGASSHSTSSTFNQSNGLTATVSRHHSTVATPTSEAKWYISSRLKKHGKFHNSLVYLCLSYTLNDV